jgi:monolysocardiolipin acyltransferase
MKAYLYSGLCSISVRDLPYLPEALNSPERRNGQGVVTGERCDFSEPTTAVYYLAHKVSNHLSTCAITGLLLPPKSSNSLFLSGSTTLSHGAFSPRGRTYTRTQRAGLSAHQKPYSLTRKPGPGRRLPLPCPPHPLLMHAHVAASFLLFFQQGQVIETFRGGGIYQQAVDVAIENLRAGAWVRSVSPPSKLLHLAALNISP